MVGRGKRGKYLSSCLRDGRTVSFIIEVTSLPSALTPARVLTFNVLATFKVSCFATLMSSGVQSDCGGSRLHPKMLSSALHMSRAASAFLGLR